MSHSDKIASLPEGFSCIASTDSCPIAAIANAALNFYGIQFHPEVSHTIEGQTMLSNFVVKTCGCAGSWTMASFVSEAIETIRATVGDTGEVIGAVSGGVDSTVAAILMQRAIGDRFHAVLVDNGLLRLNEAESVVKRLRGACGINLQCVDATDEFMAALAGVEDPEDKRKIIGRLFCEVCACVGCMLAVAV